MSQLRNTLALITVGAALSACTISRVTTISATTSSNLQNGPGSGTSSSGSGSTGSSSGSTGNNTQGGGPSVTLTWSAGAGTPQGYIIEQSLDESTFTQAASVGSTATSATISGLAKSTKYYFRLHAYNQAGISSYSPLISAMTPSN